MRIGHLDPEMASRTIPALCGILLAAFLATGCQATFTLGPAGATAPTPTPTEDVRSAPPDTTPYVRPIVPEDLQPEAQDALPATEDVRSAPPDTTPYSHTLPITSTPALIITETLSATSTLTATPAIDATDTPTVTATATEDVRNAPPDTTPYVRPKLPGE